MSDKGRVYIVTNPAFPHLFKIGYTSKGSVGERGLDNTSVPEKFKLEREYECDDPEKLEGLFHETFKQYRHYTFAGKRTEFFYIVCFNNALKWIDTLNNLFGLTDVTAEEKAKVEIEEEEEMSKSNEYDETKIIGSKVRSRTTFAMVQIPAGSILTLDIDEKAQVKTTDSKNMVELLNGEKLSLSAAANKLMIERGRKWQGVSGPWHFMFEGENIWERRLRMEKEGLI